MGKVAIITLNDYFNYGNRLQNMALQYFLDTKLKKVRSYSIWHNTKLLKYKEKYLTLKNFRRYIFNRNDFRNYIDHGVLFKEIIREYNIKKFSDKYINSVFDYELKSNLNDKYDYFIAGSDQIWHPGWINENLAFLQFADRNKRVAYAASFGVSEIKPDKVEIVRKGLEGIDYISVREQAGAKIVKDLTGKEVPVLVDPTLLLSAEEWEKIMERPVWYRDEKYILVYFLSKIPDKIKSDIKNLAEKYKLKIINLMDRENIDYYCSPPRVNFCI